MENKQQHQSEKEKFVIKIPSFQEVVDNPHPKTTSSSIFTPSPSFSQTFNFIKNSDFYAPPPAAPPPPPPSTTPPPRYTSQEHTPSPSKSTVPSRNAILVSHRQKGNPILKHIRNVRWDFADVVCDYQLGQNACALYLSLRYHLLHPDYLYFRIRELQKNYRLRVVLCYVDVEDVIKPLLEVTKTCLLHDCSLLCGWSLEECGRYLETFKVYEHKPADLIQGQMDTDYMSRLNHSLTSIRHVNKTDVVTLGSTFGSLSHIMDASMEDLARCPGIGERKVKRLYDTFHEPFKRVVPSQPPVSDPQSQGNAESSARTENEEVKEDAKDGSKRRKKEPEVTIKSALKAALSKYSDRIAKQKNKTPKDGTEDTDEGDGKWKNNENSATNASTSS